MLPRFINILKKTGKQGLPLYAGREPSAASSTGFHKQHEEELKAFLKQALTV